MAGTAGGSHGLAGGVDTQVPILVLCATVVFFEHIRKIECTHSLERSVVSDAFFEDFNSINKGYESQMNGGY